MDEIKSLFEKLQNQIKEDEDKEFEDIMNLSFNDLEDEFIKGQKTKKILIKKLHPDAKIPNYAYETDSGFDLYSSEEVEISAFGRSLVPTGISIQFDEEYEVQVRTKSGLAINQGLMVLNSPGTVDQGYRGELKVIIFNTNNKPFTVTKGMKVGQGVLCPVVPGKFVKFEEVTSLDETDRKDGGFGSTGI